MKEKLFALKQKRQQEDMNKLYAKTFTKAIDLALQKEMKYKEGPFNYWNRLTSPYTIFKRFQPYQTPEI